MTTPYILPASSPSPLQDDALDDFLGDVVSGITGLDRETLVRPRWQLEPPNFPDRTVTWCAVGVTDQIADTYGFQALADDGTSETLLRYETLTIKVSFYGPLCATFASAFRDGMQIPQNNEQLMLAGFGLIEATGPTATPDLLKEQWVSRADITWMTRREIRRVYPIMSLLSAFGTIYTDNLTVPFDTLLP